MKILIITEGNKKIGSGHLTRCLSLCQAFEERKIYPRFAINADYQASRMIGRRPHDIYDWHKDKKRLFTQVSNSEIVILDSLTIHAGIIKEISRLINTFVYIDDFKRFNHKKGIIIDWTVMADKLKYHSKNPGVKYLLGAKYASLRREFWDAKQKKIKKNVKSIMITMGGSDVRNLTPRIISLLKCQYPLINKKIIIGRSFSNTKEIRRSADKRTELIYNADAGGMKEVMLSSDIAVSAGGQTLYELARIGVPCVAINTADNQVYDIYGWQKAGFIKYAGDWKDRALVNKASSLVTKLLGYQARLNLSKAGRKFIDGKGAQRIAEEILVYHERINRGGSK